jgi:maltose alpha-D-glucosyltransferase/alpha-amylase
VREAPSGIVLAIVNLADEPLTIDLDNLPVDHDDPVDVYADRDYAPATPKLTGLEIGAHGYRWIRLRRTIGDRAGSAVQRR